MDEFWSYSVLDFVRSQKKSNLCRLLFFATVTFSSEKVLKFFNRYVSQHCADEVTGLLLVYPNYIIHLLESEENKIFEMCSNFVNSQPKYLGISKCFPMEINVVERFFDKWYARKVDVDHESLKINETPWSIEDENFENVRDLYYRLNDDVYSLCNELRGSRAISRANLSEKLDALGSPRNPFLPDEGAIRSLLENPWGDSLESLVEDYWHGICAKEVDDEVWPFPRSQCPLVAVDATKNS